MFAVYIIHASAIVWLLFANALGCLHTRSFEQFVLLVCAARRMIFDRWPVCSAGVFFFLFFFQMPPQKQQRGSAQEFFKKEYRRVALSFASEVAASRFPFLFAFTEGISRCVHIVSQFYC